MDFVSNILVGRSIFWNTLEILIILYFLFITAETRKSSAGTYLGTRTGVFGKQTYEKNWKTWNRDYVKANKVDMNEMINNYYFNTG